MQLVPAAILVGTVVPDVQRREERRVVVAVVLDDIELDTRLRVRGRLEARQPEGGPGSGPRRHAHPRLEVAVGRAGAPTAGVGRRDQTGYPTARGCLVRGDEELAILDRERAGGTRIDEGRVTEIAVPRRVGGPSREAEGPGRDAQCIELLHENGLVLTKLQRGHRLGRAGLDARREAQPRDQRQTGPDLRPPLSLRVVHGNRCSRPAGLIHTF